MELFITFYILTLVLVHFQMLQCIIGMVDKTKRAVSVLQTRCSQDREELLAWARKTAEETEAEVKRRAGVYLNWFDLEDQYTEQVLLRWRTDNFAVKLLSSRHNNIVITLHDQ